MLQIFSISLGCPKNRVDTERALGSLSDVRLCASPTEADLIFINTCGFILPAIKESVRTILEQVETVQDLEKKPLLVVAGCLVGRFGAKSLTKDLPEVDLFLDNADLASWASSLASLLGVAEQKGRLLAEHPSYAWLKISDGCRHRCAFCTIPSIRGPLKSYEQSFLVEEAKSLLSQGVKELVLVAQDTCSWGKDFTDKKSLQQLLEELLPLDGLARLRLMYLYPAGLTDDLLSYLRSAGDVFVPYFDIPLQHASTKVLSRMGRPFAQDPRRVIDKVRHYFPEVALRTSFIAGFPGESDEDFQILHDFLVESRFHHVGVFAYQQEEGTRAAAMPDQIPERVKDWRKDLLMDAQADISEEILESYVGSKQDVLVEKVQGEWPGLYTGRCWFQAPESDGITYISGAKVKSGALVRAEIVESSTYDLVSLSDE